MSVTSMYSWEQGARSLKQMGIGSQLLAPSSELIVRPVLPFELPQRPASHVPLFP